MNPNTETIRKHFGDQVDDPNLASRHVIFSLVILVATLRIIYHILTRVKRVWVCPPGSSGLREALRPTLEFAARGFGSTLWLASGHLQTFYAALVAQRDYPGVRYRRETLRARDGGIFTLDWAVSEVQEGAPTVVLLHGLTGGSQEAYIRSLIFENGRGEKGKAARNYRCVVFNARGCAGSRLETAQFYSASYTNDVRLAVRRIKQVIGDAPMVAIGFSLGSNILVKYLGEEGPNTPFVASVSVGNPFDLMACMMALDNRWFYRTVYSRALAKNLKRAFLRHREVFETHPDVNVADIMGSETVYQFDDRFTRKLFGYNSVRHYYRDSSSDLYVSTVAIPLLCLQAADDPVSVQEAIPYEIITSNPFVSLIVSNTGGHIGWFSGLWKPEPWSTQVFLRYFDDIFEAYKSGKLQQLTAELRENNHQALARVATLRAKFHMDRVRDDHQESSTSTPTSTSSSAPAASLLTSPATASPQALSSPSFVVLPPETEEREPDFEELWPKGKDIPLSSQHKSVTSTGALSPASGTPTAPAPHQPPMVAAKADRKENGHGAAHLHPPAVRRAGGRAGLPLVLVLVVASLVVGYLVGTRRRRRGPYFVK